MVSLNELGELDAGVQKFESAVRHVKAGIAVLDDMIARRLNEEAAAREKGNLEQRLRYYEAAALATGELDAILKTDPKALPVLLSLRATELAKQGPGRVVDVAQAGAALHGLEPKTVGNLYNAACAYGLCAAMVARDKPAPTDAEKAECKAFIDQSLACLKDAIAAGYKDFDYMKQDPDLALLRDLPEFQKLFAK